MTDHLGQSETSSDVAEVREPRRRWTLWRVRLGRMVGEWNAHAAPPEPVLGGSLEQVEVMPVAEHDAQWDAELATFQESQQRMAAACIELRSTLLAIVNTRESATLDDPDNVWQRIARAALDRSVGADGQHTPRGRSDG